MMVFLIINSFCWYWWHCWSSRFKVRSTSNKCSPKTNYFISNLCQKKTWNTFRMKKKPLFWEFLVLLNIQGGESMPTTTKDVRTPVKVRCTHQIYCIWKHGKWTQVNENIIFLNNLITCLTVSWIIYFYTFMLS
jgi:hypothetical protein